MDAVTYPNAAVAEFIMAAVIPLRIPAKTEPLATDFTLRWTPTLIILDMNGKEHSRTIGFITPEEFVATMLLGIARAYFDLAEYDKAVRNFERIVNDYTQSFAAPEAIYYRAVCGVKISHDIPGLKKAYEILAKDYPQSEWVKRALPYRLL